MAYYKRYKGKSKIKSKKCSIDGFNFDSELEMDFYLKSKKEGLPLVYEHESFEILPNLKLPDTFKHYKKHGKKFIKGGNNIRKTTYTPDFGYEDNDMIVIIECKGRKNESYPYRKKLFFNYLMREKYNKKIFFFEPSIKSQNSEVVDMLLEIFKPISNE